LGRETFVHIVEKVNLEDNRLHAAMVTQHEKSLFEINAFKVSIVMEALCGIATSSVI
jgi:hypothetical protein